MPMQMACFSELITKSLVRGRRRSKCGENRNHGKFKIYFLMVEL